MTKNKGNLCFRDEKPTRYLCLEIAGADPRECAYYSEACGYYTDKWNSRCRNREARKNIEGDRFAKPVFNQPGATGGMTNE